jgi:hypothetical protein
LPALKSGIALTVIDFTIACSLFVPFVKTLGEAWNLGWRIVVVLESRARVIARVDIDALLLGRHRMAAAP